jgi:hypothetical protein
MLPKKLNHKNNIVEILEDKEDEALDEYIKEEVLVKLEKDDDEDTMLGGPQEKMPFSSCPWTILSSSIHSNSSQYDPCKVWLKRNDHFLTCGATKVHIFVCTSD